MRVPLPVRVTVSEVTSLLSRGQKFYMLNKCYDCAVLGCETERSGAFAASD